MVYNRRDSLLEPTHANRRWVVQGYMIFRPNTQFTPPTDVIELDDRVVVLMELAGMRATDINVALQDRRLVISGTRERPSWGEAAYHQVEIGYGDFRIEVNMPWSVQPEDIRANYRDGFLNVELPRRPERQVHVVAVQNEDTNTDE